MAMRLPRATAVPALALLAGLALPASPAAAQTLGRDGLLHYGPEDRISRALTPVERDYLRTHPLGSGVTDVVTPPPTGPIHCAAEYEPTDGILLSWTGGFYTIQGQIGRFTTTTGNADLWVILSNAAGSQTQAQAAATLTA